ncbi:17.6 kDa class II heat shock protein [Forsythia ovata]|uniref:17.6 kDa class II heat shock protein n=1 Tax=Forsythia ovata TaxID=205694 RepID=A0ABD1W689_9LAMI
MDFRFLGFDTPILHAVHDMLDGAGKESDKTMTAPTRTYVRDAKAMAATPADVKEYPNSYVFLVDMPGLKSGDIKVEIEDGKVLVISGEKKREEVKEGGKYLKMERRVGKLMRKFVLPENANVDSIKAVCEDGVLSVTVEKLPPSKPKRPKTIEVKVA